MTIAMEMINKLLSAGINILNRFKLHAHPEDHQGLVCLLRILL